MSGTALAKYEAARSALAAAHRVDEVKDIRDKAQAMAAYARQARDVVMIQWATEIKVRAERRCGEMLRTAADRGDRAPRGRTKLSVKPNTLLGLGITEMQSSRYQKLAAMPDEHFETAVATAKATAGAVTTAHMLRVADELRTNTQVKDALHAARKNLDPVSKADAAWRPIYLGLSSLMSRIGKAGELPQCAPHTAAEMLSLWSTISSFLSVNLEASCRRQQSR